MYMRLHQYNDHEFMARIMSDDCIDICDFIFTTYHVMTYEIYTRIRQVKMELRFFTQEDEDELDLMEWILEAVDEELDNRATLEDIGMCLADFS